MINKRKVLSFTLALAIGLLVAGVVLAQTGDGASALLSTGYDLTWWTVDGGGGKVEGSGYTLVGTAGQPDAADALSGGDYTLYSGFWTAGGEACPNPLIGVSIVGPDSGYTGVDYSFTAQPDPANPTEPITYTWSPAPDSGQGTPSASYNWAATGMHTISVTVENCGGSFGDEHTISLSEQPPDCDHPLTGVSISGPSSGETGDDLTFTASITPANATPPISYTWSSDGLVSGQGTATAVYNWPSAGQHQVTLSASNCGGSDNDSQSVDISEPPPVCENPLTDVSLSGPSSGETGEDLSFTAQPDPTDATTPITYTWSTDGLVSGQGTSSATYNWASAGSKNVQVTARNCGEQDFSDSQPVDISKACPKPIVDVSITGQGAGYTNVEYAFTALPDPSDATEPVSYTWSTDGLVSGQGTSDVIYSWATTGTHTISVTVENCGGSASDTHDITLSAQPAGCDHPITGVSIDGPTEGEKETDYVFTATVAPPDATPPISYTWSADGLVGGQGTENATYRWSQSGEYQIAVSAGNCGGSKNATHAIEVGVSHVYLPLVVRNH